MRQRIKVAILVINVLLVIATCIAYAAPRIHPEVTRLPGMLSLFFPFLFFMNLFAILFWLSFGKWYALLSVICLGAGYARIGNFIQAGIHSQHEAQKTLRVATYNIFSFHKIGSDKRNAEQTVVQIAKDLGDPDILCLQESVNVGRADHPIGKYPYAFLVPGSGTLLLSKYAIVKSGHLTTDEMPSLSGWTDIRVGDQIIRVYALHLHSNQITEESEQLIEEGKLQERRTWIAAGSLIRKYGAASERRAQQADAIREHINGCPYPALALGDFNDTPQSYTYAVLRGSDMQDSFVRRGTGIGTTYAGSIPGLRIDYVLAGKTFEIVHHQVLKLPYSDHYPVVAEVVIGFQ